jgi:tetratricopeptide (TPR) repeat protein
MEDKLPPLKNHANVPDELDQFVTKALRKNQKDRYQTAGQFARDLKSLKQKLQIDSRFSEWLKSVPSRKDGVKLAPLVALAAVSGAHRVPPEHRAAVETTLLDSHPTSSAEYLVRGIRTHRTLVLAALVILVLGLIGLIYVFRNRISSSSFSLNPANPGPTPNRGTTNDEAYRNYMQGKNLVNQRNPAEVKKSIEYFQEAIRLDPNYAQPYAGLASAYFGADNSKAEAAVEKALQLDSNLAEAYAVRGFINTAVKWDFTAAEKDLIHAIELEPGNDTAHWVYAMVLADTSRFDQAIKEIETAQAIAPGTHAYERDRGRILFYARRYDEAIAQLKRAIELKPDSHSAFSWIVRAHEMKGDQAGAFDWFIRWRELKHTELVEEYRQAYAAGGWLAVKRKLLDFVKVGKDYPDMDAYEIAGNLILLGETNEAFAYFNKAVDKREWEVTMLNIDPFLDTVRDDPRFTELLKRANFR